MYVCCYKEKNWSTLKSSYQEVVDESDGCGIKFSVIVVSSAFEGKPLIHRHRSIHSLLEEELKTIHAFKQKTLTPAEWEGKKEMIKSSTS
ncbi:hypothetical protein E2986_13846 [Frieseomelitta varia]|uniref:BolA-like protein 2 n=1 Tax=Frieseomelitta varia TaxID=561572 RepID=A0A833S006_9HYME|nr:hypothetical protein E2986_13846 [Frieseomelitta varia]